MANFEDLSPEAQKIVHERRLSGQKSVGEWIEFIKPLARFDKKTDNQRKIGNYIKALWSFWMLFGVYMYFVFMNNHLEAKYFIQPAVVILAAGLLLVLTYRYFRRFQVMDIPYLLRGFLVPFLNIMKEEFGADTKMELTMDLQQIKDLEEVTAEEPRTDIMNYLDAKVLTSQASGTRVKVDAAGVEQPFLSTYKLEHTVTIRCSFDKGVFEVGSNEEEFPISDNGGQFVVEYQFVEPSEQDIEADTGPGVYHLAKRIHLMNQVAVKKNQE